MEYKSNNGELSESPWEMFSNSFVRFDARQIQLSQLCHRPHAILTGRKVTCGSSVHCCTDTKLLSRRSVLLSFSPLRFLRVHTSPQAIASSARTTMTSANKSQEEWRAILSPEQASAVLVGRYRLLDIVCPVPHPPREGNGTGRYRHL